MALGAHRDWSALAGKEGVGADDQFAGTYVARAVSGWPVPSSLGLADSIAVSAVVVDVTR
jgi:hypothetical protein